MHLSSPLIAEPQTTQTFSPIGTLDAYWYAACLSEELSARRPLGRRIFNENIVLFRDERGQPAALFDRCLHRNAKLSKGDVFDGLIGCPYHGWTYDREGTCVIIPSENPNPCPRAEKKLRHFPCIEQDGLVWVYMGDPENVLRQPYRIPYHQGNGWQSFYLTTHLNSNVTNLVENFMDLIHTLFVHAGWFRSPQRKEAAAILRRTHDTVEVENLLEEKGIGFSDRILNPKGEPMTHIDRFIMPNITRVEYAFGSDRQLVITSQITPVETHSSTVYTAVAMRFGWLNPILRPILHWYSRQILRQDEMVLNIQTENLKRYGQAFNSTEADWVHVYIESLREYAENGEVGRPPEPEERRISFWV